MFFKDKVSYLGKLSIYASYDNHAELIYSEKNIIVSGMGVGLSYLFAGDGSDNLLDYLPSYFQLGVSGSNSYQVSSTVELGSELTLKEYNNSSFYVELDQIVGPHIKLDRAFGKIINNNIKIIDDTTIEYSIVVGRGEANLILRDNRRLALNEIGLFMTNPTGEENHKPILIAYRCFDPILKSDNFSLIFKWAISKI